MEPSLQMVPQVVSLIAKELALIYNDANLVWDPPRGAPQLTLVGVSDGCVEHEDGRCLSDGLAGRQRLITLAPIAPALDVVSRSVLALRTWEKVGLVYFWFRGRIFGWTR